MEKKGIPETDSDKPIIEPGRDRGLQKLESLLDHLAQLAEDGLALQSWVRKLLKHSVVGYSQIVVGPDYPSDFLSTLFRSISSVARFADDAGDHLQTNLRSCVLELFSAWRLPDDDFPYLLEILRSISLLGAKRDDDRKAYGIMLSAVQKATYRGSVISGESLEAALIRVVFGMSGEDPAHAKIARDYIGRTDLSPLCFRKLWELKDPNMLDHIVTLLDCSLAEPRIGLEGALARFYMSSEAAFDPFFDSFPDLLDKVLTQNEIRTDVPAQGSRWMRYQSAMQNIGIDISIDRPVDLHPNLSFNRMGFLPQYRIQWQPLGRGVPRIKWQPLSLDLDSRLRMEEVRYQTSTVMEKDRFAYNAPDHSVAPIKEVLEHLAQSLPQVGGKSHGII